MGLWKKLRVSARGDQRRRAEGAAPCGDRDFAEAFWTFLCCGIGRRFAASHPCHKGVHRKHDENIDCGGNEHERQECVDEIADQKFAAMDFKGDGGKIGLTGNGGDQRCDQIFHKCGDDGPKSRAHDDCYGEVQNVAAKQELPEALEHVVLTGVKEIQNKLRVTRDSAA